MQGGQKRSCISDVLTHTPHDEMITVFRRRWMISPKEALWFPIGQVSYAQWPTTTAARHQPEQKTSKEAGLLSPCTLPPTVPVKHLPLSSPPKPCLHVCSIPTRIVSASISGHTFSKESDARMQGIPPTIIRLGCGAAPCAGSALTCPAALSAAG